MGESTIRLFSTIPGEAMERLRLFEAVTGVAVRDVLTDLVLAYLPDRTELADFISDPDGAARLRGDVADRRIASVSELAARIRQIAASAGQELLR